MESGEPLLYQTTTQPRALELGLEVHARGLVHRAGWVGQSSGQASYGGMQAQIEADKAPMPTNRSDAIRQAIIKNPDIEWDELYKKLEDAPFSRGRSWKDFRNRFYEIKGEMGGEDE